jgi:serine/threonine-protein kinase HipA
LSINDKRTQITKEDLLTIAKENSIKKGEAIINDLNEVIKNWNDFANQANVRKDLQEKIRLNLNGFY